MLIEIVKDEWLDPKRVERVTVSETALGDLFVQIIMDGQDWINLPPGIEIEPVVNAINSARKDEWSILPLTGDSQG